MRGSIAAPHTLSNIGMSLGFELIYEYEHMQVHSKSHFKHSYIRLEICGDDAHYLIKLYNASNVLLSTSKKRRWLEWP